MSGHPEPLRIVYVAGVGHSGSTLLDFLLSSHSLILSVGEAKTLETKSSSRCTCRRRLEECPFWSAVAWRLASDAGRTLRGLRMARPRAGFAADNAAFFQAVAHEAGSRCIVDSSKTHWRLIGLLETPDLEILPIHLVRDPRGVVFSHRRKGRDLEYSARRYATNFLRMRDLLRDRRHIVVRYEWLATEPRAALQAIHGWLGVPFEEGQLDWGGRERHNLDGNRLRFARGGETRIDLEWESALDAAQQARVLELTRAAWDPAVPVAGLRQHSPRARTAVDVAGDEPR